MEKKVYTFCNVNCCPVVEDDGNEIHIGEEPTSEGLGGWTTLSREQFRDLVQAAKSGKFDEVIQ